MIWIVEFSWFVKSSDNYTYLTFELLITSTAAFAANSDQDQAVQNVWYDFDLTIYTKPFPNNKF